MRAMRWVTLGVIFFAVLSSNDLRAAGPIAHDAEYYILEAQNGEKWAEDDKAVDEKLAEFR